MSLPPMRTIQKAHQELLASDPDTALTLTALRRLVITGTVPSVKVGAKYLLNMDMLHNFLEDPTIYTRPELPGKIRRVG